ncbi:hypothetical protein BDBG_16437 [Blastomyces gilchristii SLH14081]|uniref:Uncharacterized protein n=1 Tax=Blastomyces gilchristii (strain SLH14081) TaxID=559298 RepID=A0A179UDX7_BLAGS|nr:uncharacterized protein BDBG_16437 [Blastomyces gilchristii SLH14081]OAT05221.1 hypothetical protein BDBG_16437 [Blastomyces gilchristii SLH14081]
MRSYITVLIEREGSVATAVKEAGKELNTDKSTGRRDDISLQGTATTAAAVRDAEERENVIMRVILLQLIDAAASAFNLAFLTVMKAAATS